MKKVSSPKTAVSSPVSSDQTFHDLRRFAFESSRDAVLLLHVNGGIADANTAAVEVYGYSKDELLQLTIADLLDSSRVQNLNQPLAELDASGRTSQTIHRCKDGRRFSAEVKSQRFVVGGEAFFITMVRDTAAAIRPGLELEAGTEKQRRLALEAAGMGTWELQVNTGRLLWDERCKAIYGVPANQDLTYESFLALVHPEDRERVYQDRITAAREPATYGHEYRIVWPDGSTRWVLTRGGFLNDEDGKSTRLIGVVTDITERKVVEELAQRHLDQLEATYKAAPVGLCVLDRELRWVRINERLAEMNGFTVAEHIGKRVRDLLPNFADELEPKLHYVIETGQPVLGLEITGETPAQPGVIRTWKENWLPLTDRSGAIVGINIVAEEVTEARQAEREREALLESERAAREQAERSGRLKDEFLATVSHELRTPVNAILGWAEILLAALPPDSEMRHGLEVIGRNARSETQLIEELLDMSRIVAGKLALEWGQVELQGIVSACLENLFPAAHKKNIRIRREIDLAATSIPGDPDRLQQVIWNLLSNAIKFTPGGGEVRVSLQQSNSDLVLTISDTGMGIKPEFLPYVFDRFRQGDASAARQYAGLGLGLAIVKSIVEIHGGTVAAKSDGEGRGSSFTVTLRTSVPQATRRLQPGIMDSAPTQDGRLAGIHILVVDDDAEARTVLRRMLETAGANVSTTASAEKALEAMTHQKFDVLLADIGMPEHDGYWLIKKIRALSESQGGDVPAVAVTAFARAEDSQHVLEAGYQAYVAKPVTSSALISIVANLCRKNAA